MANAIKGRKGAGTGPERSIRPRGMPASTPQRSYLVGGIVLCAFPATVLLVLHIEGTRLPMPFPILFGLFFLHGLRAIIVSLFRLDLDGVASWAVDALGAAGFAVLAFWVAWNLKEGWSGGIPFVPQSWNQNFARILFACGGLIVTGIAVRLFWKVS